MWFLGEFHSLYKDSLLPPREILRQVRMRIPKVYGQSSMSLCPFCASQASTKNAQGVPVCRHHVDRSMPDLKCMCSGWLDQRESKFGVFYTCMRCGPVSFSRMMEINGDRIRTHGQPKPEKVSSMSTPPRHVLMRQRVQDKLKSGEPLTPDELEFL